MNNTVHDVKKPVIEVSLIGLKDLSSIYVLFSYMFYFCKELAVHTMFLSYSYILNIYPKISFQIGKTFL